MDKKDVLNKVSESFFDFFKTDKINYSHKNIEGNDMICIDSDTIYHSDEFVDWKNKIFWELLFPNDVVVNFALDATSEDQKQVFDLISTFRNKTNIVEQSINSHNDEQNIIVYESNKQSDFNFSENYNFDERDNYEVAA